MRGREPIFVVGGGLAGIAAALELADAGQRVTLLERRPFLGGRAYSFEDPDSGEEIDNGQHVLVGACSRLQAFLGRVGAPSGAFARQARLGVTIVDGHGRAARLAASRLPSPLHLVTALARYRHLRFSEAMSIARAIRGLIRIGDTESAALEDEPFGNWLRRHGVPKDTIRTFWDPLVRPALNIAAEEANTPLVASFVRLALWASDDAGAMWLPRMGLSRAIGEPSHAALTGSGVAVWLTKRVEKIVTQDRKVRGVRLADGETLPARVVISAVPPAQAQRIVPPEATSPEGFESVGRSAIVNVYMWYDRPLLSHPVVGVLDRDLQWVFDRSRLLEPEASEEHCVGVTLSAADAWLETSKAEIVARSDAAMSRVFPARAGARLLRCAVVKDPAATFRAAPGVNRVRPSTSTSVKGLYLAGDWIDTGWPATMEGAVRSGESAAAHALANPGITPSGATRGAP